jgi:ADP-dependent NAD(P)H-hydrate dehydratase / NAD(P)H-hydrate epimerase
VPIATTTTPPPLVGCTPLFGAAALRLADRRASERHRIPSIVLMERASLGAAAAILERFGSVGKALVVCGSGNNGGDGYAVARHLSDAGWDVELTTPRGAAPTTPDAMTMATIARSLGLRSRAFTPALLSPDRLVVDAILGIGGRGGPHGPVATVIEAIGASRAPVVSLDVPSGVTADTGEVLGAAVRAELTITFHGDKPGLHIEPGRAHAGRVVVVDIGVPAPATSTAVAWLAGPTSGHVPAKPAATDKYGAGAVLVVAGSPGLTGAGILCARATLRAGAGLTVGAVPQTVQPIFAAGAVEVMFAPIPDAAGILTSISLDAVVAQAGRVGAVVIGPGLGRDAATTAFVRAVLEAVDLPTVVDADGLWHLGRRPSWLSRRAASTILTPHAGEAARLLGVPREQVEAARLASARRLADITGSVVVLKGPGTITTDPEGTVVIDAVGTAALASAGTGDVLSGTIGAMVAKGMTPFGSAATGVAVHARAGLLATRGDGTIAGDLVEQLPAAIGAASA